MDVQVKAQELRTLIQQGGKAAINATKAQAIKVQLMHEFARQRGWKISKARLVKVNSRWVQTGIFDCPNPPIDHPYVFRDEDGKLALVTHMYFVDKAADRKTAAELGLTVEHPTDFPSWWYPGETTMVIWRKARVNG